MENTNKQNAKNESSKLRTHANRLEIIIKCANFLLSISVMCSSCHRKMRSPWFSSKSICKNPLCALGDNYHKNTLNTKTLQFANLLCYLACIISLTVRVHCLQSLPQNIEQSFACGCIPPLPVGNSVV